ncbi:MAG: polysaccharide biosynthesis protein [Lachnospiraceae bacterium]|nr:polysaccharide biosynthesis protein [Lachnospiraceae bacterium]MDE6699335.1 polysaccharide biosynthesis protein [Lachnospiraceae bacterium]
MSKNIRKNHKICFAASSGGHLEEISRLVEIKDKYDSFLVTEKGSFDELHFCNNVVHVCQINRKEITFIFKFFWLILVAFKVIIKEKPDIIISTGALATVPFCMVGKLLRKKIIYIESFARVDIPSLTGKIMYKLKLANLFIVQWEDMLQYFPNAILGGKIF